MNTKFLTLYSQPNPNWMTVVIDTETGVNYLFNQFGMCPRYNSKGEIIVSSKEDIAQLIAENQKQKPRFI